MPECGLDRCFVRDFAERFESDTQKVVRPLGSVICMFCPWAVFAASACFRRGSSSISLLKTASESASLSGSGSLAAAANEAASANAFGEATWTNNPLATSQLSP